MKHDNLDLRVPININDLHFLPNDSSRLSLVTAYGQWRMYDTKGHQRKPIVNVQIDESAINCQAISNDGLYVFFFSLC